MTRGERNNNPGNIRKARGVHWHGESPDQNDPDFVVWPRPEWGIRAIAEILLAYQQKDNCKSLRDIINRWAPPSENDTSAYLADAATRCGVGPDDPVDVRDSVVLGSLVRAIIWHENGEQVYSDAQIAAGLRFAGLHMAEKKL